MKRTTPHQHQNIKTWTQTASGLYIPATTNHQHAGHRPTAIDLFCGAGGMSLGFIQAGFKIIAACDNNPETTLTYLHNLGAYPVKIHYVEPQDEERLEKAAEKLLVKYKGIYAITAVSGGGWIAHHPERCGVKHFWFGDIRKLKGKDILNTIGMEAGEVDCVFGGPPCQGFSQANSKRNPMDPRNSLVFEFTRLILEIQPKTMVMENVPGMASMCTPEGVPVVDALCRVLEDGGFGTYEALKRSLLTSSGAGAALRNTRNQKGKKQSQKEAES